MPEDQTPPVSPYEPIALLTQHGCTPWLADRTWAVGLLDETFWLADLMLDQRWPLDPRRLRTMGIIAIGRN